MSITTKNDSAVTQSNTCYNEEDSVLQNIFILAVTEFHDLYISTPAIVSCHMVKVTAFFLIAGILQYFPSFSSF